MGLILFRSLALFSPFAAVLRERYDEEKSPNPENLKAVPIAWVFACKDLDYCDRQIENSGQYKRVAKSLKEDHDWAVLFLWWTAMTWE